jgi:predicted Zn-dependent protease
MNAPPQASSMPRAWSPEAIEELQHALCIWGHSKIESYLGRVVHRPLISLNPSLK